ncbi:hypothetical protein B0H16DRAFT_1452108 [Mycena metata]|uniref:Uncharacterized protein n=1 Tax=Mycena metata TaxID=1033252 RepID=A0AAD7JRY5_9AGAR|nr:hypothetical protein B0H16DRAFT_1452108 [Mycena metata]
MDEVGRRWERLDVQEADGSLRATRFWSREEGLLNMFRGRNSRASAIRQPLIGVSVADFVFSRVLSRLTPLTLPVTKNRVSEELREKNRYGVRLEDTERRMKDDARLKEPVTEVFYVPILVIAHRRPATTFVAEQPLTDTPALPPARPQLEVPEMAAVTQVSDPNIGKGCNSPRKQAGCAIADREQHGADDPSNRRRLCRLHNRLCYAEVQQDPTAVAACKALMNKTYAVLVSDPLPWNDCYVTCFLYAFVRSPTKFTEEPIDCMFEPAEMNKHGRLLSEDVERKLDLLEANELELAENNHSVTGPKASNLPAELPNSNNPRRGSFDEIFINEPPVSQGVITFTHDLSTLRDLTDPTDYFKEVEAIARIDQDALSRLAKSKARARDEATKKAAQMDAQIYDDRTDQDERQKYYAAHALLDPHRPNEVGLWPLAFEVMCNNYV